MMSEGSQGGAAGDALAAEVLAANDSFYRAFIARDFDTMEALWATAVLVTCIHPGWSAMRGRGPVIASWRSILSGGGSPEVVCANATSYLLGESAYVICEERIGGAVLIATNVFVREHGAWKLAHHHAGQVAARAPQPAPPEGGGSFN
jgi:hypothetical protein